MKALPAILIVLFPLYVAAQNPPTYKEKFRPQFHFTPPVNWTNDPNGLVYYKGEYHLFYQYNPFGNVWGHMSWGHAVSRDLVHWKNLPVAIPEDDHNMIFSGSCVVDPGNTSGFAERPGQVPLVAIYTAHIIPDKTKPDDYLQNQHIAYSLDDGRTWKKYSGNPVLDFHKKDFRDPKVLWYAPARKWVMATVLPHEHIVQFFSSSNLKDWTHLSDFGPAGDTNDIWECPDLLQVPIAGDPTHKKWVLINSQQTAMQYFVGTFDGTRFINENPSGKILRPDYGPDYYAAITYNNLPSGNSPVLLGWANNWTYAQAIPTFPWKSAMSLPRELLLKKSGDTWLLYEQPTRNLHLLESDHRSILMRKVIQDDTLKERGQVIEVKLQMTPAKSGNCGIRLAAGNGHFFTIGYSADRKKVYIDRSASGNTSFHKEFSSWLRAETDVALKGGRLQLQIFFDKSIVEVFINDGQKVMTAQLFPDEADDRIILFAEKETLFNSIDVYHIKSAW